MKNVALLAPGLAIALGSLSPAFQEAPAREVGVRFTLTLRVHEGKQTEAVSLVARMANYFEANHGEQVVLTVLRDPGPMFDRILWTLDSPGLEHHLGIMAQLDSEEGWAALIEEADGVVDVQPPYFLLPASDLAPGGRPGSVRWFRTLRASYGNYAAALRHARAVADYVNAHSEGTFVEVYTGAHNAFGSIHLFADWAHGDQWRETRIRLWQDEAFLDLMEGAAGLYEQGSWEEGLLVLI